MMAIGATVHFCKWGWIGNFGAGGAAMNWLLGYLLLIFDYTPQKNIV